MCTAATYQTRDFYFGRTLDYDFSYGEEVVVTPRNFPFPFLEKGILETHYGMIGMAHVEDGYPLYYDAVNEKGLCMAGLNFVGNAVYHDRKEGKDNLAQYEWISWILSRCATVEEACALVEKANLLKVSFRGKYPLAQLHWMISDRERSVVVEPLKEGLRLYENPVGVLTNNPPFETQLFSLESHGNLSAGPAKMGFAPGMEGKPYSRGMGALGLPGDLTSQSRFVRAAFVRMNSISGEGEKESVSQFFHILNSVDQQRGCCLLENGSCEITIYTSCCNADKGIYYYTTYDNHQITGVSMQKANLEGKALARFPLILEEQILEQN